MTDGDCCTTKLDELDRLLNDPDLPLQPDLIWSLLDEVIRADVPAVVAWCRMLLSKPGEMVAQHPRPQKLVQTLAS